MASQSWLHITREGQKLFIKPSICSRPLLTTSPGMLTAPLNSMLHNQWNLGAEGISWAKAKKQSLLLENGASSDAGHEDDGTGKHARGSGGGLGGRHVCVLCAYWGRVGEELVDVIWMNDTRWWNLLGEDGKLVAGRVKLGSDIR
ncbi:hypothetical protein KCU96_g54, partial [Aureobasidium melanogenum]